MTPEEYRRNRYKNTPRMRDLSNAIGYGIFLRYLEKILIQRKIRYEV